MCWMSAATQFVDYKWQIFSRLPSSSSLAQQRLLCELSVSLNAHFYCVMLKRHVKHANRFVDCLSHSVLDSKLAHGLIR